MELTKLTTPDSLVKVSCLNSFWPSSCCRWRCFCANFFWDATQILCSNIQVLTVWPSNLQGWITHETAIDTRFNGLNPITFGEVVFFGGCISRGWGHVLHFRPTWHHPDKSNFFKIKNLITKPGAAISMMLVSCCSHFCSLRCCCWRLVFSKLFGIVFWVFMSRCSN